MNACLKMPTLNRQGASLSVLDLNIRQPSANASLNLNIEWQKLRSVVSRSLAFNSVVQLKNQYPENWDGEGASGITWTVVNNALILLDSIESVIYGDPLIAHQIGQLFDSAPRVMPTEDGRIAIEFKTRTGGHLTFEISDSLVVEGTVSSKKASYCFEVNLDRR